mgnify:CR=1 FL=1
MIVKINGFEDYSVTEHGVVINTRKDKTLHQSKGSHGYYVVSLNRKTYLVHRLVADAFCINNGFDVVNHIDEDKCNNHYSNLEWCTHAHNSEHSTALDYTFISPEGIPVEVFNLSKFCRDNGLHVGQMSQVANGKRKSHKKWRRI